MKHILTFSFLLLFGKFFSQGNLQFNQVILWNLNSSTVSCTSTSPPVGTQACSCLITSTITVPQGKVWKIEAVSVPDISTPWALYIGNFMLFCMQSSAQGAEVFHQDINFPIWLPSGTYNYKAFLLQCSGNSTFPGSSASIIEFNVIP